MHPEEAGVREQVIQRELIQPAPGPGLVLVLDLLADRRHRGLGDRRLVGLPSAEQLIDVAADALGRGYSVCHGCGPSLRI